MADDNISRAREKIAQLEEKCFDLTMEMKTLQMTADLYGLDHPKVRSLWPAVKKLTPQILGTLKSKIVKEALVGDVNLLPDLL